MDPYKLTKGLVDIFRPKTSQGPSRSTIGLQQVDNLDTTAIKKWSKVYHQQLKSISRTYGLAQAIFDTAPAVSKLEVHFKSGRKWLNNNDLV